MVGYKRQVIENRNYQSVKGCSTVTLSAKMSPLRKQLEILANQRIIVWVAMGVAAREGNTAQEQFLLIGLNEIETKIRVTESRLKAESLDGPPLTKKEKNQLQLAVENHRTHWK